MNKIRVKHNKNQIEIKVEDVQEILKARPDFEDVQDISSSISQDQIMMFDCQLSQEIFDMRIIEEVLEEMEEEIDESYFDVFFEDIRAYLKDASDEIEEELQDKYRIDDIRCHFEVYNIDDSFTDFKLVFAISFKSIKLASLMNLTALVSRNQLIGSSKFYS